MEIYIHFQFKNIVDLIKLFFCSKSFIKSIFILNVHYYPYP